MTCNAMTEHYEEITVCGKPALFTSIRIRRDTIPDGLYAYDVRHDDECRGIPCEISGIIAGKHPVKSSVIMFALLLSSAVLFSLKTY